MKNYIIAYSTCRYLVRFGLNKQILFRLLDTGILLMNLVQHFKLLSIIICY